MIHHRCKTNGYYIYTIILLYVIANKFFLLAFIRINDHYDPWVQLNRMNWPLNIKY